jgi:Xaa-Pro dipeptidase
MGFHCGRSTNTFPTREDVSMTTRRKIIQFGTAAAMFGTGFTKRLDAVASMQAAPLNTPSVESLLNAQGMGPSHKMLLPQPTGPDTPPAPATYDRLPLSWYKAKTQSFKAMLDMRGIQAFLLRNPLNVSYLIGYFHRETERPQATFMNKDDENPWYFYPGLDRDIVKSWWWGDGLAYFDFPDVRGVYPYEGRVATGATNDTFSYMLEGIKKHGLQSKKLAIDGELYPSELAKVNKVFPGVEVVNVGPDLLTMREIKSPEELALWRRAYVYYDRGHAFARDYILTHGTDIYDQEVAVATSMWTSFLLYKDLDLHGGDSNYGVGAEMRYDCRCGPVTSVPHPNQPFFHKIEKNQPIQVDGICRVGGYGGEGYRMFITADAMGKFDPHMIKLWEVSRNCCDIQVEESRAGVTCQSVAEKILKYQVAQGCAQYIYHRPGHGLGTEGHQPPYIALGDTTVLKKGMCFSEEPGLYDLANKVGFNWSDTIVVGEKKGYRMSMVPYSKEYSLLSL